MTSAPMTVDEIVRLFLGDGVKFTEGVGITIDIDAPGFAREGWPQGRRVQTVKGPDEWEGDR